MKVTFDLNKKTCSVERQKSPKIYRDSVLLHQIKMELIRQGHDVIKKPMSKDGHLVSEGQHYLRERSGKWCIWWASYQIVDAYKLYNAGKLVLLIELE